MPALLTRMSIGAGRLDRSDAVGDGRGRGDVEPGCRDLVAAGRDLCRCGGKFVAVAAVQDDLGAMVCEALVLSQSRCLGRSL